MMTPEPVESFDDNEEYTDTEEGEEEMEEEEDYDINDHDSEIEDSKPIEASPEAKYDEATQQLIAAAEEARKSHSEAERQLRDVEREIKQLSEALDKDYGEESVFAVLHGSCFDYTDNEYTYKLCPFDYCSQRGKHGGAETRLGGWGKWEGPAARPHSVMKFTGGQGCWNGPARSSTVHLHCGTENTLTSVSEPNRCEYEMHFTSPAACTLPAGHDEL